MVTLNLIPPWLVALSWLYAGFIWMATRRTQIRMDSRIWGVTFILTGLLYLGAYVTTNVEVEPLVDLQARVLVSRGLMILLSVSQSLPLTISYFRRMKHARKYHSNSNGSRNIN